MKEKEEDIWQLWIGGLPLLKNWQVRILSNENVQKEQSKLTDVQFHGA